MRQEGEGMHCWAKPSDKLEYSIRGDRFPYRRLATYCVMTKPGKSEPNRQKKALLAGGRGGWDSTVAWPWREQWWIPNQTEQGGHPQMKWQTRLDGQTWQNEKGVMAAISDNGSIKSNLLFAFKTGVRHAFFYETCGVTGPSNNLEQPKQPGMGDRCDEKDRRTWRRAEKCLLRGLIKVMTRVTMRQVCNG